MKRERNPLIGGLFLVGMGLFFLLNQLFELPALGNWGTYFLAALGVAFLLWGVLTREPGLMIPGGILSGLGLGVILSSGQWIEVEGEATAAVFMFSFAFGWLLITVFTALFTDETHWWPLIVGGIMALVGASLLYQGPFQRALELLGTLWPLFLIGAGIAVLFGARRSRKGDLDEEDAQALKEKTT